MTKHYKKQERLSMQARELLEKARINYSMKPKKAISLLVSIKPVMFNVYDLQKIGREILARVNLIDTIGPNTVIEDYDMGNAGPHFEGSPADMFVRKVMKDYQVEGFPRESPRGKPYELPYENEVVRKLMFSRFGGNAMNLIKAGEGRNKEARECESSNFYFGAAVRYIWAGNYFSEAGTISKALPCYMSALNLISQRGNLDLREHRGMFNRKEPRGFNEKDEEDLKEKIKKLEELRSERDKRKASIIESIARDSPNLALRGGTK